MDRGDEAGEVEVGIEGEILATTVHARLFGSAPFRVGRFALEQRLGAGGMGVVYLGRDPDLQREVAIKLVRPDLGLGDGDDARERMLREAQAMARLRHPNVVVVHEVGEHDGGIYLAMEFVRGTTVRGWLGASPRSHREIVGAFMQAGRGLAAAHAVGLVHRDFKPDNVLVGEDGRVCVTDFGLATMPADVVPRTDPGESSEHRVGSIVTTFSSTGGAGVAGTLAYMAPECLDARPATALSDQFSFCITLYESLWGERPFGESLDRIATAMIERTVPVPPKGRGVPRRVRAAVLRGLDHDPARRFPDMAALLAELERAQSVRGSFVGLGLGLAAIAGVLLWLGLREPACTELDAGIRSAWNDDVAASIAARFADTGLPYAESTWARGRARIDGFVDAWAEQANEACVATRVHHAQTPEMLDQRMACLDRRHRELTALLAVLAGADAAAVDRSDGAIAALGSPARCGDRDLLEQREPLPADPAARAQVEAGLDAIAASKAAFGAGQFERARSEAERALSLAHEHRPTRAEALEQLGNAKEELGDSAKAADAYEQAIVAARAGGVVDVGAAAWVDLVFAHTSGDRLDEAESAARFADAELEAAGNPPEDRAALLRLQAELALRRGQHAAAKEFAQQSLTLLEQTLPADDPNLCGARMALGNAYYAAGEYEPAIAAFSRAADDFREILGAEHPRTLNARSNLASLLVQVRRLDEALVEHQEIIAARERALGPDHHVLSANLIAIAAIHYFRHDIPEALVVQQQAVDLLVRTRGPEHAETLDARENLASMLIQADRAAEAATLAAELVAIRRRVHGEHAAGLGQTIEVLARALSVQGDLVGGAAQAELAIAAIERAHGVEHTELLDPLLLQAELAHRGGDHERAVAVGRRAIAIGERAYGAKNAILRGVLADTARCLRELGRADEASALEDRAATLDD